MGGGGHRYLPLVLDQDKMRAVANNDHLDYYCINNTEVINPAIISDTKGMLDSGYALVRLITTL